ncbi:hypothetical protein [Cupriavidus sp. M-11]
MLPALAASPDRLTLPQRLKHETAAQDAFDRFGALLRRHSSLW